MKRFFKIFGITLGSIVGFVIVVVAAAVYVVLTPKRLTPIVYRVADQFVTCPYEIDKVGISIVKTFPYLGLELNGIYVINPTEGAPSDTVLAVPSLLIGVDAQKALDGDIVVKQFEINDLTANIFIGADGRTNYDVLCLPKDTTEEIKDTTSGWTLKSVALENAIEIRTQALRLADEKDSLFLTVPNLNLHLAASLPCMDTLRVDEATLTIADFVINLSGLVGLNKMSEGIYTCDLNLATNPWHISDLMDLVPEKYVALIPQEIVVDGDIQLNAHAYGSLANKTLPLVDARIQLKNIAGHYDLSVLPYVITHTKADVTAHVDLNQKARTTATIQDLFVQTGANSVRLNASAKNIFKNADGFEIDNPACNLKADLNVDLAEANRYLNTDSTQAQLTGKAQGSLTASGKLNDVTNQRWSKLKAQAKLQVENVSYLADSLQAAINEGAVTLTLDMPKNETSNIPTIALNFNLDDVQASMDTISAHLVRPVGSATVRASHRNPGAQRVTMAFSADKMQAAMGQNTYAQTGAVDIEASLRYNKNEENWFFKWNPRLKFNLQDAVAVAPVMPVPIQVPQICFHYSNRDFTIDTSRIVLGKSDFNLSGKIKNFGSWTQRKDTLVGELNFTSLNTDVDELLSLLPESQEDSVEVGQEVAQSEQDTSEADPFMVPEMVNLRLNTRIANAHAFDQDLKNLGGSVVINNGEVYLDQMGFVCEAAKLQLSAMYKTPRRDHIYVGLDYHMVDIDIQQLIGMVPQLDTLVPMLNSFRGKAQFHIAAETYVNDQYQLKPSTIRGACSIEGKDLVLLDSETFSQIAKILMFNKKTENKIDSISAQITLYKDEITVYPFSVSLDNYLIAVGGNHYLDMNFNYHADLLKPLYIGVDVKGNLDNLKITPATCIYAQDFRPIIHKDTETKSQEIRRMIGESLKKNVKIQ